MLCYLIIFYNTTNKNLFRLIFPVFSRIMKPTYMLPFGGNVKEQKVIYYSDELNDEFSSDDITPRTIDETYVYCDDSLKGRLIHFFWYRIVAMPIAFLYSKIILGQKTIGKKNFRKVKGGYFLYGNHTQQVGDPFIPNIINQPKTNYIIVHPNNVSMPGLGKYVEKMGALPLPSNTKAYRNFLGAIKSRIDKGCAVVIYPEAHIWPYYTKIRPFGDVSFGYPQKLDKPVFCFTNTYRKRKFFKSPRVVTYVDGPFYLNSDLPPAEQRKDIRDRVYDTMCSRAEKSDVEYIKYIKREQ